MNINLTKKEINKYLLTKEENILIDNIYNEFLTFLLHFLNFSLKTFVILK